MLNAICVLAGRDREPRGFLQRFQELLSVCVSVQCICAGSRESWKGREGQLL